MQFYLLASIATLLIALMSVLVWLKTRAPGFLVGFGILYYWSLYGAWYVIGERQGGFGEYSFRYLYYKMFPVYLDQDYFGALTLYGTFILTVQVVVFVWVRQRPAPQNDPSPIEISHIKLITVCSVCTVMGWLIIRDGLASASSLNVSGYAYIANVTPFYTIYQILNEAAIVPAAIGLTVWFSGEGGIYLHGRRSFTTLVCYLALLAVVFHINTLLGNRSALLFACLTSGLFYLANTKRPNTKLMLLAGVAAVISVIVPGIARDPLKMKEIKNHSLLDQLEMVAREPQSSVEAAAAHFSMYGVIHKHVPPTYGSSFVSLIASFVPRVIWPGRRPLEIYTHYATHVGSMQGQGYTIHHATAWYLNFGIPGVIMGAALLGWLWSSLFNKLSTSLQRTSQFGRILSITAFCSFTGYLPNLIRDGPEAYKAVIIESLLLPALVIFSATLRIVMRENKPMLVPLKPGLSVVELHP